MRNVTGRFNLIILAMSVAIVAAISSSAMDAASADVLAASLISQLGRSKGVVSIPNCGNGQLAKAMLSASNMKVHAMDPTQTNVDATRALIDPTGKIGPFCIIEKGTLSVMPYMDRFIDLIVITNVSDADLAQIPYAEIQRALAPDGLAFIGRATSEGAGITSAALQNWINAASKTRSTAAVSTTLGTWAVITGKELSGIDVWPRHSYDADGIRYSKDSVASYPWLPQAKMKPYKQCGASASSSSGGTTVTSGGRVYEVAQDQDFGGAWLVAAKTWLHAYSIYNGELLWMRDVTGDNLGNLRANPIIAYGRDVYLMRTTGGILQLNGITGAEIGTVTSVPAAPLAKIPMPTNGISNLAGCGPNSASINLVMNGTGGICWDFKIGATRIAHYYKPPCGVVGTIVSNGFTIFMRPTCNCGSSRYAGSHIEAPAGSFPFDQDASATGAERLEKGPAFGTTATQIIPDAKDWATHRANNSRSGSMAVNIDVTAAGKTLMWNYNPPVNTVTKVTTRLYDDMPELEPTPPLAVGGYTFFGGSDGFVRCLDNTGKLKWSYLTGGRIIATPTVAKGYVYVGSYDGYAYCINAATGQLVWRFRGAQMDRRMNLYGHLASVWPVLTGVLVDGSDNAYFCAGLQSEYGVSVYCVNALTGALKWQNNKTAYLVPKERMGFTPSGYMTIAKNRLLIANSVIGPACFDLATGYMDSTFNQYANMMKGASNEWEVPLYKTGHPPQCVSRSRDVGVVNGAFYVTGGQPIFHDHTYRDSDGDMKAILRFMTMDANGTAQFPICGFAQGNTVASTWDAADFYGLMNGCDWFVRFAFKDLNDTVNSMATLRGPTNVESGQTKAFYGTWDITSNPTIWPRSLIDERTFSYSAIALAQNAIVATYSKTNPLTPPLVPETATWYVGAKDRSNGNLLWEIALPNVPGTTLKGEPLFDGIAIDRNGFVIVTQVNGNVLCYGNGAVTSVSVIEGSLLATLNLAQNRILVSAPLASSIVIYDVLGRTLLSQRVQGKVSISTAAFARGIYYVEMQNTKQRLIRRLLRM